MLPEVIGAEIAKRSMAAASSVGLKSAHYPAPGTLPVLPTLVVLWDGFEKSEVSEQHWMHRFRGMLFTSLDPIESQIAAIDPLVIPIVDAFSPNGNPTNYRLRTTDGQGVEFCDVRTGNLSTPISYNGIQHYGGILWWTVKVRRFAGDT
jgi:hypothetical protein